jgi:hypothetical protein
VKACNEFGNDQMKIFFKHKTKMKVDHKMKNIKIVLLSHRLWFFMKHFFLLAFFVWASKYLFFLHHDQCGLCCWPKCEPMLNGYFENLKIQLGYQARYHIWYPMDITNCDIWKISYPMKYLKVMRFGHN